MSAAVLFNVFRAISAAGIIVLAAFFVLGYAAAGQGPGALALFILPMFALPIVLVGCIGMMLTGGRRS